MVRFRKKLDATLLIALEFFGVMLCRLNVSRPETRGTSHPLRKRTTCAVYLCNHLWGNGRVGPLTVTYHRQWPTELSSCLHGHNDHHGSTLNYLLPACRPPHALGWNFCSSSFSWTSMTCNSLSKAQYYPKATAVFGVTSPPFASLALFSKRRLIKACSTTIKPWFRTTSATTFPPSAQLTV